MESLLTPSGTYQLVRRLAAGAMGTVHEAIQPGIGRRVALKVLLPHVAAQPDALERLRREAQALARLDHPHTVSVYELIIDPPLYALSMELVEGEPADQRLARLGKRPFNEVSIVAGQLLSVLEAAHAQGIVHRDLKPANLIYDSSKPDPFIRVVDFGLAVLHGATTPRLTAEGQTPGTAEYMSPEQVRGEGTDARSDLYAAACVLFELLTGSAPFESMNVVHVLTAHLFREPPTLEERGVLDAPKAWQAVLRRALAKPADARFSSAAEMRQALERALVAGGRERAERTADLSPPPFVVADPAAPPVALDLEGLAAPDVELVKQAVAGVGARETSSLEGAGVVVVASLARARSVLKRFPTRPVLLCAPTTELSLLTQAIEAGVFDVVPMPLEWAEVGRRVVRALDEGT
ncbi:MAG: protein kinase [Myxococcaceae bacterium]|nr:protein kinase [Myxococcaceae bacterium]